MSIKQLSIFVILIFFLSCGSSKQVVSVASEDRSHVEETITTQAEPIESNQPLTEPINQTKDALLPQDTTTPPDPLNNVVTTIKHDLWNELLQKHVSDKGEVNYKGFSNDKVNLYNYIQTLQNHFPKDTWDRSSKLSYWINAYNAFTVDLILRNYPLESIKDIKDPWEQRLWNIDNKWYNLNDIEHQILRKMEEPRIHFAIVCASVSCPKLQNEAFTASDLETQLTQATMAFLNDPTKNIITEDDLKLSKIFKWFSKDFKTKDGNIIDFLNQYVSVLISDDAKKSYLDYNWNLND